MSATPMPTARRTGSPVLVRWPGQAERRRAAELAGVPCLLVVDPAGAVPVVRDGEDWTWSSADERDVAARLARLAHEGRPAGGGPGDLPLVAFADAAAPAARVAACLVARPGAFVGRDELRAAVGSSVDDEALTSALAAVRRRFASIGWKVRSVAGAGVLLEPGDPERS